VLLLQQDGVLLGTFPEGTRSRTGKLGSFKNGAFKMAYKAQAPIIPVSINGAAKVMSADWVMPHCRSAGLVEVVIHEPIESIGKTEDELVEAVRSSMISGLDPEQRPTA
jgi:1-acyl-sn-glycerol-3-phosphate acyltransferase